jgi:hypothetical protein
MIRKTSFFSLAGERGEVFRILHILPPKNKHFVTYYIIRCKPVGGIKKIKE